MPPIEIASKQRIPKDTLCAGGCSVSLLEAVFGVRLVKNGRVRDYLQEIVIIKQKKSLVIVDLHLLFTRYFVPLYSGFWG
ncbi:MAG: hypothetical protein ACKO96_24610, partial [Flammeovirgaceae bacterium]